VIAEWPLPEPDSLGVTREPECMYFSTGHWHSLVNGYSGAIPTATSSSFFGVPGV
jgi:hypothetical protein